MMMNKLQKRKAFFQDYSDFNLIPSYNLYAYKSNHWMWLLFFIYLITPSLLLSSLFSIILYPNLHLFKSYKYMFAICRASFMIIIIYFYLFAYVKYLLSLIMIIMLLLYLMIVNLFIIRSRFDIVVIMSLLLYHSSNYILIIKIGNSFTIFSMLDFLLIFIIIIFVN